MLLCAWPCAAALTISSATMPTADGMAFSVVMSSAYVSGATTGCFTFTGGAAPSTNAAAATAVWTSGTTATVTAAFPFYIGDTPVVHLVANPTCGLVGVGGNAAISTATATNNSGYVGASDPSLATKIRYQGSPFTGTDGFGSPHVATFTGPTGSLDFNLSTGGTACVMAFQYGNGITLYTNDVPGSRTAFSTATTYTELCNTVGVGQQSLTQSSATSVYPGPGPSGGGGVTADFTAFRCTGCVFTTLPALNPIIVEIGASYVDLTGGGAATNNVDQNDSGLLKSAMGVTVQGRSKSGIPFCPVTTGNISFTAGPDMTLYGGATPLVGKVEPDANDVLNGVALNTYTACITTAANAILANGTPPSSKLFFWGIYRGPWTNSGPCNGLSSSDCVDLYNVALAAGVAAVGNPNVVFIATAKLPNLGPDWIDGLATNASCAVTPNAGSGDLIIISDPSAMGDHPCPATAVGQLGYGKMANRSIPVFAGAITGSSFTSTGPTSGTGSISQSMALPNGATWVDIITVTSSNALDTICLNGTCGRGSLILPASLGINATSVSVNGSAGTRTLTFSGAATGWVIPAPMTITLAAATVAYIG